MVGRAFGGHLVPTPAQARPPRIAAQEHVQMALSISRAGGCNLSVPLVLVLGHP